MFSGAGRLLPHSALARRENEIIALLAQGMTQREVAEAKGISVRTVYKHRENILAKLNVHSTREALSTIYRKQNKAMAE